MLPGFPLLQFINLLILLKLLELKTLNVSHPSLTKLFQGIYHELSSSQNAEATSCLHPLSPLYCLRTVKQFCLKQNKTSKDIGGVGGREEGEQ